MDQGSDYACGGSSRRRLIIEGWTDESRLTHGILAASRCPSSAAGGRRLRGDHPSVSPCCPAAHRSRQRIRPPAGRSKSGTCERWGSEVGKVIRKGWDESPVTLGSKSRDIRLSRSDQDSKPAWRWLAAHHQSPANLCCPLKAVGGRIGGEFSNGIIQDSARCPVVGAEEKLLPERQGAWSNFASEPRNRPASSASTTTGRPSVTWMP